MWFLAIGVAALAQAPDPWDVTFRPERARELPMDLARTVLAVSEHAVAPATALCNVLSTSRGPCTIQILPARSLRDSDPWLAAQAPRGLVWVVRPVSGMGGVTVAMFDINRELVDWYTAQRGRLVANGPRIDSLQAQTAGRSVKDIEAAPLAVAETPPSSTLEAEATARLREAVEAFQAFDVAATRRALTALAETAPYSRANEAAQRLRTELDLVGSPAVAPEVETWLSEAQTDAPNLIVFWEPWCPHSQAALPQLQQLHAALHDEGLDMLGLTRLTRDSTQEDAMSLIAEHEITFPLAIEAGRAASDHFRVGAVPAAVLLAQGEVLWRGHPATLTESMLRNFLTRKAPDSP